MSLKICENQEEMNNYIQFQIEGRQEISVILYSDTLMPFIKELKRYGRTLRSSSITTDSEEELYVITKYLNELDQESLTIEPLYQYNIDTKEYESIYVKDEYVLIEEYCLDEEEIEEIVKSDSYDIVGLIEDHPELEEGIYTCEECMKDNDYCDCENCHLEDEQKDEEEQELESFLEDFVERVQETGGCPNCILEILKEVYCRGYVSGSEEEALNLYNALHERLYGED